MASGYPDWLRAFSMLGKYGDDYVVVAVDATGNLYALLQGMTPDDELQTVLLDDDGRMSAFVIDSTDAWGRMLAIGNAELAARLGSPVLYERTGKVQFIETFESGRQTWTQAVSGTGATVELSPVYCASGGYSVKLTGGSDTLRYALVMFRRGLLPAGKMGFRVSFAIPTTIDYFRIGMTTYDGATARSASVRFTDTNDDLEYLDSDGNWQKLEDVKTAARGSEVYNQIKLVADFSAETYLRCLWNQTSHDMSAYSVYTRDNVSAPYIECLVSLYSRAANNDIVYIDDVILTSMET